MYPGLGLTGRVVLCDFRGILIKKKREEIA